MDDSPEVDTYDESFSAEDDDEDLCRICRSPEEPGNPLRYPCSCRGSIKFVHGDCLRTWLNRRGNNNKCELCGRSYSFVPVYSENAPERLPCDEFLLGVLLRVAHYMKLILLWIPVILFNTLCISLHPSCQVFVADAQTVLMSRKLAYLWVNFLCSSCVAFCILIISFIRIDVEDFRVGGLPGWFLPEGGGLVAGVLHFLWKYMKILCDWYYLKLIQFLGQPHRIILVPPVTLLDEFGVFRRLLFFFDDHVFAGLAISVFFCTLFVLLPFSVGWVVIATVGGSYLSGKSPVLLGYILLQSSYYAYFGILFILHHSSLPVIVRCLALGVHYITVTVTLPCHLLAFLVKACKNILLNRDAFVLFLKFGALPWIVGWFLEICTSPMFGTRSFQIYEIFFWMMSFRWLSGVCYLVTAAIMQIQEIMHKRAFWYLLDVTDPNYKITKLNLRHMFFALASHGVLLVIMFHLPIKSITLVSPSFFPLELWVSDESCFSGAASAIYFGLMHAGSGWLIVITKPAMELIVHKWIITVSSWLQLSDFLLVVPRGEGMMQPRRPYDDNGLLLYSLAEGSMVTICKSHNAENDVKEQRHNSFRYRTRIAIMLMLAALSLFLVSTAFMSLPILVGRVFSYSISFILLRYGVKHDDLCAFWIGYYILRAIYISLCFAFDHIRTGRTDFLVKYVLIRIRNALLFSIWISIIPGLLGLLIDLMIIIPLRVPLNESPIYFLIQDWLIGVVVLHLWTFLTMLTPIKCFATKAWRRKFERIRNVGINSLPSMWLFRDVTGSIINTLLTTLSIPYVLVKSLLPLLGYSQSVNAATERVIWPVSLALIAVWFMTKLTFELIIYLHKSIFNERYMVGERVGDLTEDL